MAKANHTLPDDARGQKRAENFMSECPTSTRALQGRSFHLHSGRILNVHPLTMHVNFLQAFLNAICHISTVFSQ